MNTHWSSFNGENEFVYQDYFGELPDIEILSLDRLENNQ